MGSVTTKIILQRTETSVLNYHSIVHKIPEEHRSHLHQCRSLKSHILSKLLQQGCHAVQGFGTKCPSSFLPSGEASWRSQMRNWCRRYAFCFIYIHVSVQRRNMFCCITLCCQRPDQLCWLAFFLTFPWTLESCCHTSSRYFLNLPLVILISIVRFWTEKSTSQGGL
jgi:hypothetical protein